MVPLGRYLLLSTLLTVQTDLPVDEVSKMANVIDDHGFMIAGCSVLLIMTLGLFLALLRRTNRDENIVKLLVDLTNTINNIKNSDIDVAGSFDKHNTKFILEIERVKSAINEIQVKLNDIDHESVHELKQIMTTLDQECSEISDNVSAINRELKDFRRK